MGLIEFLLLLNEVVHVKSTGGTAVKESKPESNTTCVCLFLICRQCLETGSGAKFLVSFISIKEYLLVLSSLWKEGVGCAL